MSRPFERPATIALPAGAAGEGATLEGLFVPGPEADGPGVVIAAPHPTMGGSMDSPVVTEIALAAERAGLASLRFNWRGVGASAGAPTSDTAIADVDFGAALAFLDESVGGPLHAAGYSFGAATALRASVHHAGLRRLVLVAPPPTILNRAALLGFEREIFIAVGDRDPYADHSELAALAGEARAAHFELIPDCDHFFMTGLGVLGRSLADWW